MGTPDGLVGCPLTSGGPTGAPGVGVGLAGFEPTPLVPLAAPAALPGAGVAGAFVELLELFALLALLPALPPPTVPPGAPLAAPGAANDVDENAPIAIPRASAAAMAINCRWVRMGSPPLLNK